MLHLKSVLMAIIQWSDCSLVVRKKSSWESIKLKSLGFTRRFFRDTNNFEIHLFFTCFAWVCSHVAPVCLGVYILVPGWAQVCLGLLICARVCSGVLRCAHLRIQECLGGLGCTLLFKAECQITVAKHSVMEKNIPVSILQHNDFTTPTAPSSLTW